MNCTAAGRCQIQTCRRGSARGAQHLHTLCARWMRRGAGFRTWCLRCLVRCLGWQVATVQPRSHSWHRQLHPNEEETCGGDDDDDEARRTCTWRLHWSTPQHQMDREIEASPLDTLLAGGSLRAESSTLMDMVHQPNLVVCLMAAHCITLPTTHRSRVLPLTVTLRGLRALGSSCRSNARISCNAAQSSLFYRE